MAADDAETFSEAPELMGASPAAETARVYVARAADTRDPVLISAERGLDVLAVCRAIHVRSELTAAPFTVLHGSSQSGGTLDREFSQGPRRRTIVLSNLDELPALLQHRVAQLLDSNGAGSGR